MSYRCRSAAILRCILACALAGAPVPVLAAPTTPAVTVDSLNEEALTRRSEAVQLGSSPDAAAKYNAAAAKWAEALGLELETPNTWERRHNLFCLAAKSWTRAFDLGTKSRKDTELAKATATAYADGLKQYDAAVDRQPKCQASVLLQRADDHLGRLPPEQTVTPPPKLEPRPVPAWQIGLLSTFAVLTVAGSAAAIALPPSYQRGSTIEDSGKLYQQLHTAVERYGMQGGPDVALGGNLCTSATRADATVDGLCDQITTRRNAAIGTAVVAGASLVGTAVLAGLIGRHRRNERVRAGVAWRPGGAGVQLQLAF